MLLEINKSLHPHLHQIGTWQTRAIKEMEKFESSQFSKGKVEEQPAPPTKEEFQKRLAEEADKVRARVSNYGPEKRQELLAKARELIASNATAYECPACDITTFCNCEEGCPVCGRPLQELCNCPNCRAELVQFVELLSALELRSRLDEEGPCNCARCESERGGVKG